MHLAKAKAKTEKKEAGSAERKLQSLEESKETHVVEGTKKAHEDDAKAKKTVRTQEATGTKETYEEAVKVHASSTAKSVLKKTYETWLKDKGASTRKIKPKRGRKLKSNKNQSASAFNQTPDPQALLEEDLEEESNEADSADDDLMRRISSWSID